MGINIRTIFTHRISFDIFSKESFSRKTEWDNLTSLYNPEKSHYVKIKRINTEITKDVLTRVNICMVLVPGHPIE